MSVQEYKCPACGAPLTVANRFSKTVVCGYCNQTSLISTKGLAPVGETAELAEFPSIFAVGKSGKIKGREFQTLGRIRYGYEEGFWDEWFLSLDGGARYVWLQEDEGEFTMFEKEAITTEIPLYTEISVGRTFEVNGKRVFVTEKNEGEIKGGEGELNFRFKPGETFQYIDGNSGGQLVSIEITPEELAFSVGESVDEDDIEFSNS